MSKKKQTERIKCLNCGYTILENINENDKKILIKANQMKKIAFLSLVISLLFFTSCSKHIYVNYQSDSTNTGKVVLKPSTQTEKTFVTINDNLLVDKKNVKSVTINNVPNGEYVIHYTSESGWYTEKLNAQIPVKMENSKEITKLVEVPPYSAGYWIYLTGVAVLPWLVLLTL